GRRRERLEIGEFLRGRETAAPAVHVERPRLRDGALRQEERPERRTRRSAARPAQEGAAPAVETPAGLHRPPSRGRAVAAESYANCATEPMQTGTTPPKRHLHAKKGTLLRKVVASGPAVGQIVRLQTIRPAAELAEGAPCPSTSTPTMCRRN